MRLLSLMKANGYKPKEFTYLLIVGLAKVLEFDTTSALLLQMLDQGLIPNNLHYTCSNNGEIVSSFIQISNYHIVITVLSHCYHSVITLLSQRYHIVITVLSRRYHIVITS